MQFGEFPIEECENCILAHSQLINGERISKGTLLTSDLIEVFVSDGYQALVVARLDADDVEENAAATQLARFIAGNGTRLEKAHTGRVNIYAKVDGLLDYNPASVIAVNSVSSAITCAVIAADQWVLAGRMIGSVKIIPYAVPAQDIGHAIDAATPMQVHSPVPKSVVLIQTTLPSIKKKVLEKTERVTRQRIEARSAELTVQHHCEHRIDELSRVIEESIQAIPDLVLIVGASAISDQCDVIPAAVESVGGQVQRLGLPVDPGNLLMMADYNGTTVLGLPGCARSPRHNGLDLLLDRLVCNIDITDDWLNSLCIGGLLSEAHDRPQPRVAAVSDIPGTARIAALMLAAGSSRRAGYVNKLLHPFNEKPMVCAVLESVLASRVTESLVVTGYQADQVEQALQSYDVPFCHCPRYAEGMAHTIAAGVSRLQDFDAVIVCLGDMPHITANTINQLVESQDNPSDKIIVPVHRGVRGNPVMVGRTFFDSLLQNEGDNGARFLIRQYPDQLIEVEIDDASILQDYDTRDALNTL